MLAIHYGHFVPVEYFYDDGDADYRPFIWHFEFIKYFITIYQLYLCIKLIWTIFNTWLIDHL